MKYKLLIIGSLMLLLAMSASAYAADDSYVVVNDKDWRSIYLGAIYADTIDANVLAFTNLADAQLKTRFMAPESDILIIEAQSRPVVKNYESFLKINGYENFETILVDDYVDAQNQLRNLVQPEGLYVFDGKYGFDPLAATTFITTENYFPYFLPEDGDVDEAVSLSRRLDTITSGHIPVREAQRINGEVYTGPPYSTVGEATKKSLSTGADSWGIITRIDAIDIQTLQQGLPFFVFAGNNYIDDTAALIDESGITRFEVIGGVTADIARDIEARADKDLDMLLKYGRRITNYPGLGDAVLDIDAIPFGFPTEDLSVDSAVVYPEENTFALTYSNNGNIDIYVFTSIEFDSQSQTDSAPLYLPAGETRTVGYEFDSFEDTSGDARLTVQFGYSFPLRRLILNGEGSPIYDISVDEQSAPRRDELTIGKASLDTQRGIVYIDVESKATENIQGYIQLVVDDETTASSLPRTILADQTTSVAIPVPYISNERLADQTVTAVVYYGPEDTIYSVSADVEIKERLLNTLSGFVTGQTGLISMGVLVVVLLIIVAAVIARKRTKKKVSSTRSRSAPKKSTKKKTTAKKSTKKPAKKAAKKKAAKKRR